MSSYIGLPGALVEIRSPSREVATPSRASTELVPFSGRRVVQLGRRVRRAWALDWSAQHPQDYAVLDALTTWETPLVWVGALAQATNLLTPEQSTFSDATFSGGAGIRRGALVAGGVPAVQWAGGPVGSAVLAAGGVPVRAGVPVTVSAWTQRAAADASTRLTYTFRDATGATITSANLSGPSGTALQRVVWTVTPPAGAADVLLLIRDAAAVVHPQVTWTPGVVDYAPGRGVDRVVVLPGSESPLVAHSKQVLTSAAYTILEVG